MSIQRQQRFECTCDRGLGNAVCLSCQYEWYRRKCGDDRPISKGERRLIKELDADGKPPAQIAKKLEISISDVKRVLREAGRR